MADISDLTNAVTSTIAGALLTNFTTGASVLGYTMKVYTGWPMNDQLDTDLANADRQYLKNGTIAPSDYICHICIIATLFISHFIEGSFDAINGQVILNFIMH